MSPKILCIGVFPKPLSGMTHCFDLYSKKLSKKYTCQNIHKHKFAKKKGRLLSIEKIFFTFFLLMPVLLLYKFKGFSHIYCTLNSGSGKLLDAVEFTLYRYMGYKVFAHHHSYGYIHNKSTIQSYIQSLSCLKANIFLSEGMKKDFIIQYGKRNEIKNFVQNNWYIFENLERAEKKYRNNCDNSLVFGHLSNLTVDKGAVEAIEIVKKLNAEGIESKLLLAGPIIEQEVANFMEKNNYGFVDYLGPLYGKEKEEFFKAIDFFLFPTKYKNEAQPLVLAESLFYNSLFFSYDIGTIKEYYPKEIANKTLCSLEDSLYNKVLLSIGDKVVSYYNVDELVGSSLKRSQNQFESICLFLECGK
jgi:glycosyltransferase involved in cell wall biosynthesis